MTDIKTAIDDLARDTKTLNLLNDILINALLSVNDAEPLALRLHEKLAFIEGRFRKSVALVENDNLRRLLLIHCDELHSIVNALGEDGDGQ